MKTVLFICSGNVFRSLTAMLALKQALDPALGIQVESAGTHARIKPVRTDVIDALAAHGLDPNGHTPRLLTAEILNNASLVVVMGAENRNYLKKAFGYEALYFNEIAHGKAQPVIDLPDAVPDYRTNKAAARAAVAATVAEIVASIPNFAAALPRFLTPGRNCMPPSIGREPPLSP